MTRSTVRVAIIGAGASGLVGLKTLLETFARDDVDLELDVVVFEKSEEVGGVWYDDGRTKTCSFTLDSENRGRVVSPKDPSPMYEGLRTNLPHDLMSFRDHVFPDDTPEFPSADQVESYLVSYADRFNLKRFIRFSTPVTRLYKRGEWIVESKYGEETFDRVMVSNGHYAETFMPSIPGLSTFTGKITHSKYYRNPDPYIGQTILIVGSFASGSDLARLIASSNLAPHPHKTPTRVYVSSEGENTYATRTGEWARYITDYPLIDHINHESIIFKDGSRVDNVDTVIFATGYYYSLPFCRPSDQPWRDLHVLDPLDQGLKGMYMSDLDPLLLFLKNDTSIAFPLLQYQIVPFPMTEVQSRLISYHWSDLVPSIPKTPLPLNPTHDPDGQKGKVKKTIQARKEFVFGFPYEWTYEKYLMEICYQADLNRGKGDTVPECWRRVEPWRRQRRDDKGLRQRTLGY